MLSAAADVEARSAAERALGLAAIELGEADAAVSHLRRAVVLAESGGFSRRAGEARMSLSWALTQQGDIASALVEAERALPGLEGASQARMLAQRATILQRLGRFSESLESYRVALIALRRADDALWEARLLCNRGVLQVHLGELPAAEADLRRAEALHASIGQTLAATQVRHNLGWVAARRGDVPAALAWYDRVEAEYRSQGVPLALLLMDRCDVLLSARLSAEALANALAAVAELEAANMGSDLAEARLLAAHAELLAGDSAAARSHALQADATFIRQGRTAWAALARAAVARAEWMEVEAAASEAAAADGTTAAASGSETAASGAAAADGAATVSGTEAAATGTAASDSAAAADHADGAARRDPSAPSVELFGLTPDESTVVRLEAALAAARRAIRALDAAGWGVEALDARLIAGRAALALGRPRSARRQLELAAAARHRGPVGVRTRAWHAAALLRLSHGDRRGAGAAVAAGLRALEQHRLTLGATELRAHASGHGEELATLGLRLAVESGSAARVLAAAERRRAAGLLLRPVRPPDDEALAAELAELRRVTADLDESLRNGRPEPALTRRQALLESSVRRRALRTSGATTGDDAARARSGDADTRAADDRAGGAHPRGGGAGTAAGDDGAGDADTRAADDRAGGANPRGGGAATRAGDDRVGGPNPRAGDDRADAAHPRAGDDRAGGANPRGRSAGTRAGEDGAAVPPVSALTAALGERVLVEFFALDGRLHAVTVVDGRAVQHALGAEAAVHREVSSLRFSLRSVATARPGSRAADAMADICTTVAQRLDALLLAPLRLRERPLVIVPTGELHALPWSMLPSLHRIPLTVTPSLRLWHRAATSKRDADDRAVLVAGPRLPAAEREIETLRQRHPHATTLAGKDATVQRVSQALDGAESAHVAAHGRFRDDNPQFCSLELADGALTVYDLERLKRAPRRLVLSSCESGLSAVHAGDELMGFTAAVFALGTETVIAAVVPVPDEATAGLMLELDLQLQRGTPPANALVGARAAIDAPVAAAAFVCFGAG